jgi:Flp pilus assembly protein TadG
MRRGNQGRSRSRGAAVIEFALTLPLLVPLMLFMIEYGHYYWVTLNAVEAAKLGLASAVAQNSATPAANCSDTTKVNAVTQNGHDAAVAYFTTNAPSLASASTPTVTCVSGVVNSAPLTNPSWQIIVKMDFRPLVGFRLPWFRASTTVTGGITYSTPALIRTL